MELLSYDSVFYMNTNIIKDKQNKFIKGKAKELIEHLKFTLPNLYLSYANGNIDIEDVEHIQQEYFTIIDELEKIDNRQIVKVCENEMMESLYIEEVK